MENYYLLGGKDNSSVAFAFAPKEIRQSDTIELINTLETVQELPFKFTLVKLSMIKKVFVESPDLTGVKTIWLDYQPNSEAWPLFSGRMKNIIEEYLTGKENISWISAMINGNDETRTYFIPRFDQALDTLDISNTSFVPGTDHVIQPVFSYTKIKDYSVIHYPGNFANLWKITSGFYVNEKIKKAILKEKFTGVIFEKTAVMS
jgi:hypothetical protein